MKLPITVNSTGRSEHTAGPNSVACFQNQHFWMKCRIMKCSISYGLSNRAAIPRHSLQRIGLRRKSDRKAA